MVALRIVLNFLRNKNVLKFDRTELSNLIDHKYVPYFYDPLSSEKQKKNEFLGNFRTKKVGNTVPYRKKIHGLLC